MLCAACGRTDLGLDTTSRSPTFLCASVDWPKKPVYKSTQSGDKQTWPFAHSDGSRFALPPPEEDGKRRNFMTKIGWAIFLFACTYAMTGCNPPATPATNAGNTAAANSNAA